MTIYVLPRFQKTELWSYDATSNGRASLSPFVLGPVMLYDGMWSRNVENAWQYSKVYMEHLILSGDYWQWAKAGWDNPRAVRYPMGKGAKPLYSYWAGEQLGYIEARKRIYAPLYSQAVRFYQLSTLMALLWKSQEQDICIRDYDAYDHRALGYSWDDVIHDPERKMGHGFVLAMMLEGVM